MGKTGGSLLSSNSAVSVPSIHLVKWHDGTNDLEMLCTQAPREILDLKRYLRWLECFVTSLNSVSE